MVRVKDSRPRYSKDHYSAPIVTISVDEKQQQNNRNHGGYHREDYIDKYSHHQPVNQIHSNSTTNDDDFNEYDYEIIDGRGGVNNPPRIDFGGSHHQHPYQQHQSNQGHAQHRATTKYDNCFKNIDSDYDVEAEEEEEEEEPMPLPDIRPTKNGINLSRSTGSFRTALNNHPLVKQQQQRQQSSIGNNAGYEKIRPTMGTKIHLQQHHQKSNDYDSDHNRSQGYGRRVTTTANARQRRQSFDGEAFRVNQQQHHYGRGYEHENDEEEEDFSPSRQQQNQQVRLEDVQPYLEEIDEIDEEMPKPAKTIQILATGGTSSTSKHSTQQNNDKKELPRQWEPLHHQQQQQMQQPSQNNQQQKPPQHQHHQPSQQPKSQQPQKSQHQKELEEIQQKIQQRRQFAAAKEAEDDRLYDLEMARPTHTSKVRSVVDLLNKEPSKGKDSLRCVMTTGEDHHPQKVTNKVPPTISKASSVPPPPPPPQNLLIKAGSITPKLQKPTPVSLATDEVKSQNDTLPPPPPQLQYRTKLEPPPINNNPSPKSGIDILSDEADLLLQYFKSNWQIVDYLSLKIPNEIIDRMNRLPRKIVFIREGSDFSRVKRPRRSAAAAKRLRGRKIAAASKIGFQKQRVIERVASMKSEEISRIVSGASSLSRQETEREGEIYDTKPETKIYAKSERRTSSTALEDYHPQHQQLQHQQLQQQQYHPKGHPPNPAIRQSLTESSEEPVYEDSKWSIIKKGGRFVKKSAAALITKKQSPCPTPVQYSKPQISSRDIPPPLPQENNAHGLRTESRIAAEIKNLKEREEELRRNRAAMGLPNVHDLIGNWKNQDSRMCPLRETRSFNHLKINVNDPDGQRNWPPLQNGNGHYGMTKSESFHQLHQHQHSHMHHHSQQHQHNQAPPPPPPPQQQSHSTVAPKYYRRGTYDINASVNSNTTWTPVEKNYRRRSVAATLVNRRIHSSRPPLPIYLQHPQQQPHQPSHQHQQQQHTPVLHPSIIQQSIHNFNRNTPLMKSGSRPLSRLLFVSKRKTKTKSGRMGL